VNSELNPHIQEELEVPYEIVKWQRNSDEFAPKQLKDVHPLGLAPIIVDGDITIAESGAIVRKKSSYRLFTHSN
jgi:glutathione S-transferase